MRKLIPFSNQNSINVSSNFKVKLKGRIDAALSQGIWLISFLFRAKRFAANQCVSAKVANVKIEIWQKRMN